jgi:hypothetical protein
VHSVTQTFLIQLLLPIRDDRNQPFDNQLFSNVRATLADHFGGVTAYQRSPAKGVWKRSDGSTEDDDLVMIEVEAETLDRRWWDRFRRQLEQDFRQEQILVRAIQVDRL